MDVVIYKVSFGLVWINVSNKKEGNVALFTAI